MHEISRAILLLLALAVIILTVVTSNLMIVTNHEMNSDFSCYTHRSFSRSIVKKRILPVCHSTSVVDMLVISGILSSIS